MKIKTYSELIKLPTFIERYRYLRIDGYVGKITFGWERYLNQKFYHSKEWKDFRNYIITRDMGCDLGVKDNEIAGLIILHHMNPITPSDLRDHNMEVVLNPENTICTSMSTHNAIHFGNEESLKTELVERRPGDTCLWKTK